MPIVTLTPGTADAMGLALADLLEPTLSNDAVRLLEGLLRSRGFDMTHTIHVTELADAGGFVLTQ